MANAPPLPLHLNFPSILPSDWKKHQEYNKINKIAIMLNQYLGSERVAASLHSLGPSLAAVLSAATLALKSRDSQTPIMTTPRGHAKQCVF